MVLFVSALNAMHVGMPRGRMLASIKNIIILFVCPKLKDRPKNEQLAEKRSFEGNCEILRTIFQPRALFSDIPAAERGLFTKYII